LNRGDEADMGIKDDEDCFGFVPKAWLNDWRWWVVFGAVSALIFCCFIISVSHNLIINPYYPDTFSNFSLFSSFSIAVFCAFKMHLRLCKCGQIIIVRLIKSQREDPSQEKHIINRKA
jgi:hypothetical protein